MGLCLVPHVVNPDGHVITAESEIMYHRSVWTGRQEDTVTGVLCLKEMRHFLPCLVYSLKAQRKREAEHRRKQAQWASVFCS